VTTLSTVEIGHPPQSIEEFVALRDRIADTPQGGAVAMVVALLIYAKDRVLGEQALTIAVDRGRLQEAADGYRGWQVRKRPLQLIQRQILDSPHIPRSYFLGTSPESGYQLPEPPLRIECRSGPYSGDEDTSTYKVFVTSSGAPSARPVTLHRNQRGFWKAFEWSSLLLGVRPPAERDPDDL
jgi:hypothetical protein